MSDGDLLLPLLDLIQELQQERDELVAEWGTWSTQRAFWRPGKYHRLAAEIDQLNRMIHDLFHILATASSEPEVHDA